MKDYFYLSTLIVSKLCHDLTGSANACKSGTEELKGIAGELNEEAIDLAYSSAKTLNTRLLYFRNAIGSSTTVRKAHAFGDLTALVNELFEEKSMSVIWQPGAKDLITPYLQPENIKYILNIFLLIFLKTSGGATISVSVSKLPNSNKAAVGLNIVNGRYITATSEFLSILGTQTPDSEKPAINVHNVDLYFLNFLKENVSSLLQFNVLPNNTIDKIAFTLKQLLPEGTR